MHSGAPTGARIVLYFFLMTVITAVLSLSSPVAFGTVHEIPQSPAWGGPVVLCEVPSVVKIPACAVDSQGKVHVVYYDKTGEQTDIFYVTIQEGTVSDPRNLTEYDSLKESVSAAVTSEALYVAFLDNRKGRWQLFLLNTRDNQLTQITNTETHKEDVFLSAGPNDEVVITWTDFKEGVPRILLTVVAQDAIQIDQMPISGDHPSTRASTVVDTAIHVVYLGRQAYDHVMYTQLDLSGEKQGTYDLGDCIHLDPVLLGTFKGPRFVVTDTITCVWSDSRSGSQSIYYCEATKSGEIITAKQVTDYPLGMWSWMPCIVDQNGTAHIVYVNNGFGHRLFHAAIDQVYEELGTVTSGRERATAPFLVCDDNGHLHCVYLQFREDSNFNLTYRNTYKTVFVPEEESFSEKMEESSIRYVYSFALSFLFAFPFTFGDNILGIIFLAVVFFVIRSVKVKNLIEKVKGSEYAILTGGIAVSSLLRWPVERAHLAPVVYNSSFVVYGLVLGFAVTVAFKYLMKNRFNVEIRIVLSWLVFLYLFTFFLLLPVIPHI